LTVEALGDLSELARRGERRGEVEGGLVLKRRDLRRNERGELVDETCRIEKGK